jgi:hypothetical protein
MKSVINFSRSNYRKALKTFSLSAVAVRTSSWWANAMRASASMGVYLKKKSYAPFRRILLKQVYLKKPHMGFAHFKN